MRDLKSIPRLMTRYFERKIVFIEILSSMYVHELSRRKETSDLFEYLLFMSCIFST